MPKPRPAALVLAALVPGALALGVLAPMAEAGPPALRLAQAESYSEEKLQAFARAAVEVEKVRAEHRETILAAPEEERPALTRAAIRAILATIDAAPGITSMEYATISKAATEDPALASKLTAMIEAAGR